MTEFIDTHVHLQDFNAAFAPQVLQDENAKRLVLVSAYEEDFAKIAGFLEKYPQKVQGAFGVHPWCWRKEAPVAALEAYLKRFSGALVGEIGVDALKEEVNTAQHELFSAELAVAEAFSRPVILHAAKAFFALREHEKELGRVKYVHHGFVRNDELLRFINKTGGYIGLGALFLKQERAAEMWKMMPADRVLFETDAPYRVSQEGYGAIVQQNLEKLAEIAGEDKEALAARFVFNAEEFLRC